MDFKLKKKEGSSATHQVILLNAANIQLLEQYPQTDWFNTKTLKEKSTLLSEVKGACHFFIYIDKNCTPEKIRRAGAEICAQANAKQLKNLHFSAEKKLSQEVFYAIEGAALANYKFLKYQGKSFSKPNSLSSFTVEKSCFSDDDLLKLQSIVEGTYWARDLVNEPLSYLTAENLSKELKEKGKTLKIKITVMTKPAIEKEKMGGLLAVNKGSVDPPTFNIMEWKPKKPLNKKPIVLVGKGVVYDTGGLSLKPTPNSMDFMKSDMGGAAAVAGAMYSVAKAKLDLWVIALIPATDNRPGLNAYVPGDVIKMHNGMSVEVLNTDAEGRMLLADALSYAKRYDPEMVIDLATLTGSAARAVGKEGVVFMGNSSKPEKEKLQESGNHVHERLVELPLWEEYKKMIQSDIADIKNVGGASAGAITAGIFLQYFTEYPWMHIDIASMAFFDSPDAYRLKNGTGVGTRLLFDYLSKRTN
ncbi:MAG: leucyl aminopeptidase family protein [Chitinophagales bacterium]